MSGKSDNVRPAPETELPTFITRGEVRAHQPTNASIIELSGVVKWFDREKGYGFILPDNGLPDALIHITCLKRAGLDTAREGARVHFDVIQKPRGLEVVRIISMDESTSTKSRLPPEQRGAVTRLEYGPDSATVKSFNRERGFGFLTRGEGTRDIYVHMITLRSNGIPELLPGQRVLVRYGDSPKGLEAVAVVIAEK